MKRFLQVTVALIAVFLIIWNLPSWGITDKKSMSDLISDLTVGTDYVFEYNTDTGYKSELLSLFAKKTDLPTNTNQLTNGSGFLTGYTETDPLFNTKFSAKSTTDLAEGNKLFYTDTRSRNAITLTTTGSGAATYNPGTGALIIPFSTPTYNNAPARSLVTTTTATGVQLSATKATRVSYSITHTIALTLVITSGSSQSYLEISPTNATGSWITINQAGYSDGVGVAVVLNKTQTNNLQGEVPAGYYVRIRSVTSGGGSASFTNGQETIQ